MKSIICDMKMSFFSWTTRRRPDSKCFSIARSEDPEGTTIEPTDNASVSSSRSSSSFIISSPGTASAVSKKQLVQKLFNQSHSTHQNRRQQPVRPRRGSHSLFDVSKYRYCDHIFPYRLCLQQRPLRGRQATLIEVFGHRPLRVARCRSPVRQWSAQAALQDRAGMWS